MSHVEINPSPIIIIAEKDEDYSIRVVDTPEYVLDTIWNNLPIRLKNNNKMKRYFKYKLDNPPLRLLLKLNPLNEEFIKYVKGHGMSMIVKIPRIIEKDLAYILGAIRDGGIHYDELNNAYKIHFAQKEKQYLINEIQPRLRRLFGINTSVSKRKDGVHQIQFASKPIYLFFSEIFEMKEIQQYWSTPSLIYRISKSLKKGYIKGFFDAEGTKEHIYHSWYKENECPPLEFISNVLNHEFNIRCTHPLRIKTSDEFNRFPAYQLFINDFHKFQLEILDIP